MLVFTSTTFLRSGDTKFGENKCVFHDLMKAVIVHIEAEYFINEIVPVVIENIWKKSLIGCGENLVFLWKQHWVVVTFHTTLLIMVVLVTRRCDVSAFELLIVRHFDVFKFWNLMVVQGLEKTLILFNSIKWTSLHIYLINPGFWIPSGKLELWQNH